MRITFRQIDAFRTVVSTGTATEAAQVLGVSQPAVSRLISDLEREVGFKLFVRSGRNVTPTPEARQLVEEVRRALSGLERIKEVALAIRNFQHAQLRLITTPTYANTLAARLIGKFATRRPEAMISLEVQSTDDTVEWLISQNHDFGIASPAANNPTLKTLEIVDLEAKCILPMGHRLAKKQVITPADLEGESFVSYLSGSKFKFDIDEIFRKAGVTRVIQYGARTTQAIECLVAESLGVSIIAPVESDPGPNKGFLTRNFSPGIPFKASLNWSKNKAMTAVAKDFLEMVAEDTQKS
jgi:DNA-binding transcriptional LysR family regulator